MGVATQLIDTQLLGRFSPLTLLSNSQLAELAKRSRVIPVNKGEIIFEEGDVDQRTLYLLSGNITLFSAENTRNTIHADSVEANNPLATESKRAYTARANVNCTLLCIETAYLNAVTNHTQQPNNYEVAEIETDDGGDWIKLFLKSSTFLKLPAENIQALLSCMKLITVRAGQIVLEQGAKANSYYIIKQGNFKVTHRSHPDDEMKDLAMLEPGDGFGEDALISHGRRNARLTALEDGCVMRLSKQDFTTLLANPILSPVSYQDTLTLLKQNAVLIDVRSVEEYQRNGLNNSINIPFATLRTRIADLNPESIYVTYCNNGNLSAAASFAFNQHGIKSKLIAGGLRSISLQKEKYASPTITTNASQENSSTIESAPAEHSISQRNTGKTMDNQESEKKHLNEPSLEDIEERIRQADVAKDDLQRELKRIKLAQAEQEQKRIEQQRQQEKEKKLAAVKKLAKDAKLKAHRAELAKRETELELAKLKAEFEALKHNTLQASAQQNKPSELEPMRSATASENQHTPANSQTNPQQEPVTQNEKEKKAKLLDKKNKPRWISDNFLWETVGEYQDSPPEIDVPQPTQQWPTKKEPARVKTNTQAAAQPQPSTPIQAKQNSRPTPKTSRLPNQPMVNKAINSAPSKAPDFTSFKITDPATETGVVNVDVREQAEIVRKASRKKSRNILLYMGMFSFVLTLSVIVLIGTDSLNNIQHWISKQTASFDSELRDESDESIAAAPILAQPTATIETNEADETTITKRRMATEYAIINAEKEFTRKKTNAVSAETINKEATEDQNLVNSLFEAPLNSNGDESTDVSTIDNSNLADPDSDLSTSGIESLPENDQENGTKAATVENSEDRDIVPERNTLDQAPILGNFDTNSEQDQQLSIDQAVNEPTDFVEEKEVILSE